eukprot:TRINITY_DN471_c0_g2_i4.p1 TRINITY_DN471_c0_g2~~TRINITY_DN471_c0_g2_i4.p1  ORF type:complete len:214 (-),score=28.77 TRINITY_DN471_c0_g2_i4:155-796(-)
MQTSGLLGMAILTALIVVGISAVAGAAIPCPGEVLLDERGPWGDRLDANLLRFDSADNLYFTHNGAGVWKRSAVDGSVTLFAGNGNNTVADGEPAVGVSLAFISALAINGAGDVYIASRTSSISTHATSTAAVSRQAVVRRVRHDTGIIDTILPAGSGLDEISGMAFDSDGRLLLADPVQACVVRLESNGSLNTLVDSGHPVNCLQKCRKCLR